MANVMTSRPPLPLAGEGWGEGGAFCQILKDRRYGGALIRPSATFSRKREKASSRYCTFFSSFAIMSTALILTPQAGKEFGVKKLSVRFAQ